MYSQPCLSRSRICWISPKSKVYTKHHSFTFYCFLPRIIQIFSYTPFISPKPHSLRTQLRFQIIGFTADTLRCASVCFHTERGISVFWRVQFIKRSEIHVERKDVITAMHFLVESIIPSNIIKQQLNFFNGYVIDFNYYILIFGRVIANLKFGNKHVYFHNGQTPLAASARASYVCF